MSLMFAVILMDVKKTRLQVALEKVNKKGMRSLKSMFGAAPKKPT